MASALLASRNDAHWGERKVYMRKNSISNANSKLGSNPNPNPSYRGGGERADGVANPNHDQTCVMDSDDLPAPAVSDDCSSFNRRPPAGHGAARRDGYVTFDISGYSRHELRELKRRLVSELDQVRSVSSWIDSLSSRISHPEAKAPIPKRPTVNLASEKIRAAMMKRCAGMLTKLMKHKGGVWFNVPVDAEGMGLHDYHLIIKSPMDLGTVRSKLQKGLYSTPMDFASDVRLTFNNALRYNPQGHEVNKLAGQLLRLFDGLFQPAYDKFQKQQSAVAREMEVERHQHQQQQQQQRNMQWSRSPPVESVARPEASRPEPAPVPQPPFVAPPPATSHARPQQQQQQQQQQGGMVGRGPPVGRLPKPKAKDENKRAMSMEEKQRLGIGLQNLPPEKMEQVVHIVRRRNGLPEQEGDEIELDFELMDNETLWELDRFLSNFKKMMSKIKRQEASAAIASAPSSAPAPMHIEDNNKSPRAGETAEVAAAAAAARRTKRGGEAGDEDVDIGEYDRATASYPPVEIEKDDDDNESSSSSSDSDSSSSSGSGSSSETDSDEDNEAQSPAAAAAG